MSYVGRAAIAALTVFAGLAIGGCETHKAGADQDSANNAKSAPEITINAKSAAKAAPPSKPPGKPPVAAIKPPAKPPAAAKKPPVAAIKPPTRPPAPPPAAASKQCKKTVAHMMKFYKKVIGDQIAKVPAEMQARAKMQAAQQLQQLPKRLLQECTSWSDAAQTCVQRAKSFEKMAAECGPLLKPGSQASGQPTKAEPADETGGPSCKTIAGNAVAIIKKAAGYDDRQAEMLKGNVVQACLRQRWSPEVKSCIHRASRKDQFDECMRVARISLSP